MRIPALVELRKGKAMHTFYEEPDPGRHMQEIEHPMTQST